MVRNRNSGAKVCGAESGFRWCGGARCGTGKPVRVPTTVYLFNDVMWQTGARASAENFSWGGGGNGKKTEK